MRSHEQIIEAQTATELARVLDLDPNTVFAWKRAKSIPAAYWRAIVAARISTFDELSAAAESRRRVKRA